MHDSFAALLERPSAKRYKQLRSQLLAGDSPVAFSLLLAEWEQLLAEAPTQAIEELPSLLPAGILSLRLHRLAGDLCLKMGDHERARLHRFTFDAVQQAILATGKGTRRQPLLIAYPSDAAELLAGGGRTVLSQSLVEDAGRRLDVLLTEDEREFWFDVTDLLPVTAILAERRKRPAATAKAIARKRKSPAAASRSR